MRTLATMLRTSLVLMLLCGLLYHLAVTGIAQLVMPRQANGSLVYNDDGEMIGSELIGQAFADPKYFHGRVSSIEYDAAGSGSPNYAPSNGEMIQRTRETADNWQRNNPDVPLSELPIDLVSNSASGLDPHISPAAARAQIPRISNLTGMSADELEELVQKHTRDRDLGLFGEPAVNVLMLNLDLQQMQGGR